MPETIKKVTEEIAANAMMKRDGETYMAVGAFLVALAIPVVIGTYWALANPHAAVVNAVSGIVLALIGGASIWYGWVLFQRAKKKAS